ncbi:hypothetical protein N2152v2_005882 [Parachlorella kessleri]
MADTRTPRVELRINVLEKPREPHVLRATKRHLVCEYDGLVFKQPREEEPAAVLVENMPLNRGTAATSQASQEKEPACQRDSSATPCGIADESPADCGSEGPPDDGSLEALCCSLFETEASTCSSVAVAEALRGICRRLCSGNGLAELQQEPQRGMVAARADTATPPPAPAEQEVEQGDYQVDLEARKAGLRARLAGYEKEVADWDTLVQEAEQFSSETAAAGVATPGSEAAEPADIAELKKMHEDLHRHLTIQAEGLCKLVGDVEELVDRANRTAHTLQAEYHQEKFQAFPHVDSPARLIREIVKPPPKVAQQQQ